MPTKSLPYSQDEKFMFPADFRPCDAVAVHHGGGGNADEGEVPEVEEVIIDALE